VQPVERGRAVLVALAASRPEVGHDPVLVVVAVNLPQPVLREIDLELDRIVEEVAEVAFPLRARDTDEAASRQRKGPLLKLRRDGDVEPAHRTLEDLVELVVARVLLLERGVGIVRRQGSGRHVRLVTARRG
jgi:hypothetical protein